MRASICFRYVVLVGAAVLGLSGPLYGQAVWYVDDSATSGAATGQSWEDAFVDFQSALDVCANGDEVRVAGGVYKPSIRTDTGVPRSKSFVLVEGVSYLGGYAGLGDLSNPEDRDPLTYESVLSGDIGAVDDASDNCHHVLHCGEEGESGTATLLSGFAIRDGRADTSAEMSWGGGMIITCHITVDGCRFEGNMSVGDNGSEAACGGAVAVLEDDVTIQSCVFVENSAEATGGDAVVSGGAIYAKMGSTCEIRDSRFVGNISSVTDSSSSSRGSHADGGAISLYGSGGDVERCKFMDNHAYAAGGAYTPLAGALGGAVRVLHTDPVIRDCVFSGNSAESTFDAAAMWTESSTFGGALCVNSSNRAAIAGCLFYGNKAVTTMEGTGFYVDTGGGAVGHWTHAVTVTNCSFIDNTVSSYVAASMGPIRCQGGALYGGSGSSESIVSNSIFWGNRVSGPNAEASQVYSASDVSYCCVQGGHIGEGNISLNPKLGPDGHVQAGSPCIDAGDSGAVNGVLDLAGHARLVDDPSVVDTGMGDGALVDMGAYEYQSVGPVFAADLDRDGDVDLADFAIFEEQFGGPMQ